MSALNCKARHKPIASTGDVYCLLQQGGRRRLTNCLYSERNAHLPYVSPDQGVVVKSDTINRAVSPCTIPQLIQDAACVFASMFP